MDDVDRRSFLRTSGGVAATAAAIVGVPVALLDSDADAAGFPAAKAVANPTGDVPDSPVMAYVADAKKGTVVIMSGTTQRTVQDRELVHRLLVTPKKPKKKRRTKTERKSTSKKKG